MPRYSPPRILYHPTNHQTLYHIFLQLQIQFGPLLPLTVACTKVPRQRHVQPYLVPSVAPRLLLLLHLTFHVVLTSSWKANVTTGWRVLHLSLNLLKQHKARNSSCPSLPSVMDLQHIRLISPRVLSPPHSLSSTTTRAFRSPRWWLPT